MADYTYEVQVPEGVRPGDAFSVLVDDATVSIMCPTGVRTGQKVRFRLPQPDFAQKEEEEEAENDACQICQITFKYGGDGWRRVFGPSEMKHRWVHVDDKGVVGLGERFNIDKSAYVRRFDFQPGTDPPLRAGILNLVPAREALVDMAEIDSACDSHAFPSCVDLAKVQKMRLEDKEQWFYDACAQLLIDGKDEHFTCISVRREVLLDDSVDAVMELSPTELKKAWRVEFKGETTIDAEAVCEEWFRLVFEKIFDPEMGLWETSTENVSRMDINRTPESCCEERLVYFRFLGRMIGRALAFDHQCMATSMVQYFYKLLIGWPISFQDLEEADLDFSRCLKKIAEYDGISISDFCLDFTVEGVDIVKDGKDIEVTVDNFPEYLEACFKYMVFDKVRRQLTELILGFTDVVPEQLLIIFDYKELDLLLRKRRVDMEDWMENTLYTGEFESAGANHLVVKWFWEAVKEFDPLMVTRLLAFVMGSWALNPFVPARGFGELRGPGGIVAKFTIKGVSSGQYEYPYTTHPPFNCICLPLYHSKQELKEGLIKALTWTEVESIGIE